MRTERIDSDFSICKIDGIGADSLAQRRDGVCVQPDYSVGLRVDGGGEGLGLDQKITVEADSAQLTRDGISQLTGSVHLRQGDKEWWIDVSTGAFPLHGYVVVLEKQGMKQSLGFLDATAMKQAIDRDGRVALYINFDVDKATLRPDAQPVIDEIRKLLEGDAALKLSIEGHTDNTGTPAHNLELSTARARSVLGALVGVGIDPARLQSRGFGQDKPLADNATEDGRAKNRRVELVKR